MPGTAPRALGLLALLAACMVLGAKAGRPASTESTPQAAQPPQCDEACQATCLPTCYQLCANGNQSSCPAFEKFGGDCPAFCDAKCCPSLTAQPELAVPPVLTASPRPTQP